MPKDTYTRDEDELAEAEAESDANDGGAYESLFGGLDSLDLDLTGVQGRELYPSGTYAAELASIEDGEPTSSGNDQLVWKFVFTEGQFTGHSIFAYATLTPKSLWYLKRLCEACSGEEVTHVTGDFLKSLIGSTCKLRVVQSEYNGRVRNNVADAMPVRAAEPVTASPSSKPRAGAVPNSNRPSLFKDRRPS